MHGVSDRTGRKANPNTRKPPVLPDPNYVAHWRRVGPLLSRRRLQELGTMTAAERRRQILSVLGLVLSPPQQRSTSGLVEYSQKAEFVRPSLVNPLLDAALEADDIETPLLELSDAIDAEELIQRLHEV